MIAARAASLLAAPLACLVAAVALAGSGETLTYRGGGRGKVVFDHQLHAAKGFVCNDCHTRYAGTGTQLFATHKSGLISFADHRSANGCFACHDGRAAFNGCDQCHREVTGF